LIGHFFPEIGVAFNPLGDGFISLIKMMIAPVIFCTVAHGLNKVMANPVALGEAFEEQPGGCGASDSRVIAAGRGPAPPELFNDSLKIS
jgi:hypothetical protein